MTAGELRRALDRYADDTPVRALIGAEELTDERRWADVVDLTKLGKTAILSIWPSKDGA